MKTVNIGTRLALGLFALCTITAAFGAFSYFNATNVDQSYNHLKSATLPSAYLSEDVRSGVQRQYTLLQQFLNSAERSRMNVLDASLTAERSRNADLLAKLQSTPLNDDMRRLLDSLKSNRDAYTSSSDLALSLARTGTEESRQGALDMDAQFVRPAYAKYFRSADALVAAARNATVAPEPASDAFSLATSGDTLGYLAFAVLLSFAVSVFIFVSIAKPISNAVEVFRKFSSGDLSCRAKVTSDDELGQLLAGLNWQLDNQCHALTMATRMADGDFGTPANAVPEQDLLGQALLRLRRSVQASFELADRIVAGDLTSRFRPIPSEDKLAQSLFRIRERLGNSTEVAKQIAGCDFKADLAPAEAGDVMGQSLVRLRENLKSFQQMAARLSSGDLEAEVLLPLARDPITRSLVSLRENLLASARVIERVSDGDLSVQAVPVSQNDALGNATARLLETLRRVMRAALASASSVASAGTEILFGAEQLRHGSGEHAAASAETASAIGAAASSLQINIKNSLQTDQLAATVARDAELGGEVVSRTIAVIKEVAEKMGELDEIARKTDMLTLTAAIEAARAGDHGLGFGVVATELRKLGERNAAIAAEITRIGGGAVKTAHSTEELLSNLISDLARTGDLMRQVASCGAEQTTGLTRADQAVQQLESVLHENVFATDRISALADQLMAKAKALESGINFFTFAEAAHTGLELSIAPDPAILQSAAGA